MKKYWYKFCLMFHFHVKYDEMLLDKETKIIEQEGMLRYKVYFWLIPTITWESDKEYENNFCFHVLRICFLFWTFTPICFSTKTKY